MSDRIEPPESWRRLQAGDRVALEETLVRWTPSVVRFANRLCDDRADADDVVQETLISAARRLPHVRSPAAVSTWLFTVARSHCAKKRRKAARMPLATVPVHEVATPGRGPDEDVASRQIGGAIEQAIRSLEPGYREVLLLRDVEGFTAPEVASALGLEVATVKTRLHRARVALRDRLAPSLEGVGTACPDVAERFSRFLEDDIGPQECAALQAHVSTCATCNAACALLERTLASCRQAGSEVPPDVALRVRRALQAVIGDPSVP